MNGMSALLTEEQAEELYASTGFIMLKQNPADVERLIAEEEAEGMCLPNTYRSFANAVSKIRANLLDIIATERAKGNSVAGYGASVGTTAMLPQFALTDQIDFILDDDRTSSRFYPVRDTQFRFWDPMRFTNEFRALLSILLGGMHQTLLPTTRGICSRVEKLSFHFRMSKSRTAFHDRISSTNAEITTIYPSYPSQLYFEVFAGGLRFVSVPETVSPKHRV